MDCARAGESRWTVVIGNEGGGSAVDNIVTARRRPRNGEGEARPCLFHLELR